MWWLFFVQFVVFVEDLQFDHCGDEEREVRAAMVEFVAELDKVLALVAASSEALATSVAKALGVSKSRIVGSAPNLGIDVSPGKRRGKFCSVRRSRLPTDISTFCSGSRKGGAEVFCGGRRSFSYVRCGRHGHRSCPPQTGTIKGGEGVRVLWPGALGGLGNGPT